MAPAFVVSRGLRLRGRCGLSIPRAMRNLFLHEIHERDGARLGVRGDAELVLGYGPIEDEWRGQGEVSTEQIGLAVLEQLRVLDEVAYMRFASVYKQFRDLDDLLDEVREVLESSQPEAPNQGRLF